MTLAERVSALLNDAGIAHAVVGAAALAAAGVAQDLWDIRQLLAAVADRDELVAQVEEDLLALPDPAARLWGDVKAQA